jgi:glucoamylase
MQLRDALDDYKRHNGDRMLFSGERRTTTGRFSGSDGRLVHVDEDGSIRDFSYPIVGLTGITRSRFGIRVDGQKNDRVDGQKAEWFDVRNSTQRYYGDTTLVVTHHETAYGTVVQHDLTVEDVHVIHIDVSEIDEPLSVVAAVGFAPDGRDTRIAQLHHGDAVEVYHAQETDYLASATGFDELRGSGFDGFAELLDSMSTEYPRNGREDTYGEDLLSGDVIGACSPEDGTVTFATLLTTRSDTSRKDALDGVRAAADQYSDVSLEHLAEQQSGHSVDSKHPHSDAITADLRVVSLLTGQTGLRIAGPDFDPYFAHSGGYGYSWFRDDAEISQFLLDADRHIDIGLSDWLERSAKAYTETQLDDGTWPHRVWSFDATLAPGWANARITNGDDTDYQADQTASVAAYLAAYDDEHRNVLEHALDGLDDSFADDDRPVTCQNAWEDMSGRFTHTTATFLEAYSRIAATGVDGLADRARARATAVYDAIDDLWIEGMGIYALREYGEPHENETALDERCDSATLALVSAHRAYAQIEAVDERRLGRLVSHVETTIDELRREPTTGAVAGLVRYEGDSWRCRDQNREKIWTVSTVWGAYAAGTLAIMLTDRDDERAERMTTTARELLELVLPDGPLCLDNGYLPEQMFDDGTPDSATPLGWSHALRLATIARMDEYDLLEEQQIAADD